MYVGLTMCGMSVCIFKIENHSMDFDIMPLGPALNLYFLLSHYR
jgi:hypothetical protein